MTDPDPATTAVPNHVVVVGASAIAGMDSAEIGSVPRVRIARMVLEHAWPLIEAQARAAERQRIRQLAIDHDALWHCVNPACPEIPHGSKLADLLGDSDE